MGTYQITSVSYERFARPDGYDAIAKLVVYLSNEEIKENLESGQIPNFYNLHLDKRHPDQVRAYDRAMVAELIHAALGSIPEGIAFERQEDFSVLAGRWVQYYRFKVTGERYARFYNPYPLSIKATEEEKSALQPEIDDHIAFLSRRKSTATTSMSSGFAATQEVRTEPVVTAGFTTTPQLVTTTNGQSSHEGERDSEDFFDDDLPF